MLSSREPKPELMVTRRRWPAHLHGGPFNGLYAMLPLGTEEYVHLAPDGHHHKYLVDPSGRLARYYGDVTDLFNKG